MGKNNEAIVIKQDDDAAQGYKSTLVTFVVTVFVLGMIFLILATGGWFSHAQIYKQTSGAVDPQGSAALFILLFILS